MKTKTKCVWSINIINQTSIHKVKSTYIIISYNTEQNISDDCVFNYECMTAIFPIQMKYIQLFSLGNSPNYQATYNK